MKNHVKSLNEFVNEREEPKEPVAVTQTTAPSKDELIPLQVQDPVHSFGVWNQTFGGNNSSNSTYADQILAQAAIYGMTPEEYIAYYGFPSEADHT